MTAVPIGFHYLPSQSSLTGATPGEQHQEAVPWRARSAGTERWSAAGEAAMYFEVGKPGLLRADQAGGCGKSRASAASLTLSVRSSPAKSRNLSVLADCPPSGGRRGR